MRGGYKTEQKQRIYTFFMENREHHFAIDEVCLQLNVPRSTIYRQVNSLLAEGVLRRFESETKSSFVYQYADNKDDCLEHYHMKCTKCGRLLHVHCSHLKELSEHFESEHNFMLGKNKAVLYGECKECMSK